MDDAAEVDAGPGMAELDASDTDDGAYDDDSVGDEVPRLVPRVLLDDGAFVAERFFRGTYGGT